MRYYREKAELSQSDLARRLKKSVSSICRYEGGEQAVGLPFVCAFCAELKISIGKFFGALPSK